MDPCFGPIQFEPDERGALIDILRYHLRNPGVALNLGPLQRVYGKVFDGNDMTTAELRAEFGDHWYISKTGRALSSRGKHERPITPRQYELARQKAIQARGFAVTA